MIRANSQNDPGQPWHSSSGNGAGPVALHVEEVDVDVADLGHELRELVDGLLLGPPVEAVPPVGHELLQVAEIGAVLPRPGRAGDLVGPPHPGEPGGQVVEDVVADRHPERPHPGCRPCPSSFADRPPSCYSRPLGRNRPTGVPFAPDGCRR